MNSDPGEQDSILQVQPLRQRTKEYALRIINLYSKLPQVSEAQVIGKQLLCSGTSVGANYREATRSRSSSDMIAKFGICLQELEESAYWMELLSASGIITEPKLGPLLDETTQLIAIFTASIKRISSNAKH